MRALRKIVFVNSAHIRYAEVRLDGNVHFIGTQGVGKSTLLRAILFFYNADKLHLGIPKEMKSFDEFYLPHANSYIVYEVEHEHGPFSILTFRSSGRACYRFIDAEYSKEWLVDSKGEVTAESKVIRERLGGAYMSKIIDRYELYRDILYGNKQAVGKEFARFQLMESNRYQNIPRSIQNVFLNSRLDANFIKDIIIRSMSEEEANIDLGYFRRQVSDFEQEYKDISCWYRLNQKGESIVHKQADTVVKAYHELLYMKQQIKDVCGELKYAMRTYRERLPLIEKKVGELQDEQSRQNRLLDQLQQKFDDEKSKLNQKQGVVNDQLERLKKRKDYYASQQIEQVLKRFAKEQILKDRLEGDKARLTELTSRYNDVTAKYNVIRQSVKNLLETYRQSQSNRILQLGLEKQQMEERMLTEHTQRREEVEASFTEKIALATNAVEQLKDEQTEVDKELLKLKYWLPYKEEIDKLNKSIENLALREKELCGMKAASVANINRLQAEYDKQEAEMLAEHDKQCKAKQQEIDGVTSELAEIEGLLARTKGSLYEWLEGNKRDWEQNIGKVISEEHVLYQTGLHPQKTDGASLFGVKLDLIDLPISVRKPAQLQKEKAKLESKLLSLKKEYVSLMGQQEKQVTEMKRPFVIKMKDLRSQKSAYEIELQMIPQKRKAILVDIEDYTTRAKQEKDKREKELIARQQELAHRRTLAEESLVKVNANKQKQLDAETKRYQKARNDVDKQHNQQVAEIRIEIKLQEQKTDAELLKLNKQELDELHGRGADTRMVEECKTQIQATETELKYIDNHRRLVFEYQRDKEELFDCEDELKGKKKAITEQIQQLNEKYNQRRQKYQEKLTSLGKELNERRKEQERINGELQKADRFAHDENLCPPYFVEAQESQSLRTPGQAVDDLTSIIVSRQSRHDQFKGSVNVFKSHFSAKNTFNFRIDLTLDEDFMEFANNLDEFLVNNKIEEYRRRTSERYVDILARVSKEMGELTRHESDVDKIIHDINSDFRERNFAGVIKLIALQHVPSADKMVQLMKRIKDFNLYNS